MHRHSAYCTAVSLHSTAMGLGTCWGMFLKVAGWRTASPSGKKAWSKEEWDIHMSVHVRDQMDLTAC